MMNASIVLQFGETKWLTIRRPLLGFGDSLKLSLLPLVSTKTVRLQALCKKPSTTSSPSGAKFGIAFRLTLMQFGPKLPNRSLRGMQCPGSPSQVRICAGQPTTAATGRQVWTDGRLLKCHFFATACGIALLISITTTVSDMVRSPIFGKLFGRSKLVKVPSLQSRCDLCQ